MDQNQEQQELAGYLKWYNPAKGFGFVVEENTNKDILLHANVLQKFGRNSIAEGALIDFKAQKTSRGLQVAEILSIDPSSLPRPDGFTGWRSRCFARYGWSPRKNGSRVVFMGKYYLSTTKKFAWILLYLQILICANWARANGDLEPIEFNGPWGKICFFC